MLHCNIHSLREKFTIQCSMKLKFKRAFVFLEQILHNNWSFKEIIVAQWLGRSHGTQPQFESPPRKIFIFEISDLKIFFIPTKTKVHKQLNNCIINRLTLGPIHFEISLVMWFCSTQKQAISGAIFLSNTPVLLSVPTVWYSPRLQGFN